MTIFKNNGYPKRFVDLCIKKYLDIDELICVIPFIGKKSLQLITRLVNSIEYNLKFCKLKVIFQSPYKLNSLFCYKDSLKKEKDPL